MLAANQTDTQSLSLIKLLLSIASDGIANIPQGLLSQFDTVADQARRLKQDPSCLSKDVAPESIELALDLKSIEGLSDSFDSFQYKIENVTPAIAAQVLSILEHRTV